MSKRLQVVMSDSELKVYERAARARGMPLSEWVRQALRAARQADPGTAVDTKLAAIRAAAQNRYPTADVDDMLAEIERGYAQGSAEGSGP